MSNVERPDRVSGRGIRSFAYVGLLTVFLLSSSPPGSVRVYSTAYSIGIEWSITGDPDHDATVLVGYRAAGSKAWKRALPLVRVDFNGSNMLAGSILFLTPDTTYELTLTLTDPDAGTQTRRLTTATRPLPTLPSGGRTLHVVPGSGGGDGSQDHPFKGVASAEAMARPGDLFVLHAGNYGGRIRFTQSGTATRYIAWKAAGDGEALFQGIEIAASYVWLEGVTLRDQSHALLSDGAPAGAVINRCTFINNTYAIHLLRGGRDWYIADNVIVGNAPVGTQTVDGEGIELNGGNSDSYGHIIAHNRISNVADGISNGDYNIDVFGNDLADIHDDAFEGEPGRANIRFWGNRVHNTAHHAISFQPQEGAPWYIVRNQLVGTKDGPFKFRQTDRAIIAHNTIVNWGKIGCCDDSALLRSVVKNNLWIAATGGQIWDFMSGVADWRTDIDSNGFDWGDSPAPFRYGGVNYQDLSTFAAASGLEAHGRQVSKTGCFAGLTVPGPPPSPVPAQHVTLTPNCRAIDAGTLLPNINDDFIGNGPDLGAYEHGHALPHYGPRFTHR